MAVSRQVRRQLGGMDPAVVRQVLALAERPIESEICRVAQALHRCSTIDADDLRALGRIAALEAAQTFGEHKNMTLRSWIGSNIRWRIAEAMKDAGDCASVEIAFGGLYSLEQVAARVEVEETYEFAAVREWILRSLAGLSPRQKILLAQRLANNDETWEELAASLGVDRTQLWRDFSAAVRVLSVRFRADHAQDMESEASACA